MAERSLRDPFQALEDTVYPEWALSLYLPAAPDGSYDSRYHEKVFEQLDREHLAGPVDDLTVEVMHRERPRVTAHLRERTVPAGQSLAVFAYEPYGLLRSWCLAEGEPPLLALGTRLHMDPIHRQLATHPPLLIAAADKEEARVYRVLLGEVEQLVSLEGAEVKRHHQGGWSSLSYQRREDQVARQNLAAVARWLNGHDLGFYARLHLAGPAEARAELKRALSPRVRSRLAAELAIPMYLSPGEMAQRLREELLRPAVPAPAGG